MRIGVLGAGAVLVGCLGVASSAAGGADGDSGIRWVKASNGSIPSNAVSAGKDRRGRNIFVCRISRASDVPSCEPFCAQMLTPGRLVEGEESCIAEVRGVTADKEYEVLVSRHSSPELAPRWVKPFSFPEINHAILGGVEVLPVYNLPTTGPSVSPNLICRIVQPGGYVVVGKRVGDARVCQYVNSKNPPQSLNGYDFENRVEILIDPSTMPPGE